MDIAMNDYDEHCPKFKRAFWRWFDDLSSEERKRFNYATSNMAPIFFYNKIWRHKK